MRFINTFPLILTSLLLAGCSSSTDVSSQPKKVVIEEKVAPTVEGLIARGCDKYLAADSKGASADFTALTKLNSTYKQYETANQDIIVTMKGVTTVEGISDLPDKDRNRVYESIVLMENLCAGIDAP